MKKIIFLIILNCLFADKYTINRISANSNYWVHSNNINNIVYKIDFKKVEIGLNLIAGIFPEHVEIIHHKGTIKSNICFINHNVVCFESETYIKSSIEKIISNDAFIIDKNGSPIMRNMYGDWLLKPCDTDCFNKELKK